tara:strand:- start:2020 stop:3354 length:1335 start_codon:yes stop_codon:yes gene_type:complete
MAEPSEGFFAGCALCTNQEMDAAVKDETSLQNFYNQMYQRYMGGAVVGAGNVKKDFEKAVTLGPSVKKDKFYSDLVVGISAVKAVRSFLARSSAMKGISGNAVPNAVYLTGTQWPDAVQQFKFAAFGMADYNSSDLILQYGSNYVGVSLKKKPKGTAPDPTLINKAFDTVLNGPQFNTIKTQLQAARQNFFAGVIKEALISGPLVGLAQLPDGSNPRSAPPEKLWSTRVGIYKNGKIQTVPLINLKDVSLVGDPALLNAKDIDRKTTNAMRDFVNSKLGKVGSQPNSLYKQFLTIIKQNQQLFADTLINLILKKSLSDTLSEYTRNNFEFILTTGVGQVTIAKSTGMNIQEGTGTCIGIDSVGLALAYLRRQPKTIDIDEAKTAASNAAKLFFKVKAGPMDLLELELRYKGDFKAQPQFQAFLSTEFKSLLKGEFGNARNIIFG